MRGQHRALSHEIWKHRFGCYGGHPSSCPYGLGWLLHGRYVRRGARSIAQERAESERCWQTPMFESSERTQNNEGEPPMPSLLTDAQYLASYEVSGECWIYTRSINNKGYGTIRGLCAHRFFYEHMVGPIPDGLTIDHLCRNRACVNPAHLEPVTQRVNNLRRPGMSPPHCPQGHEFTPENTYTYTYEKRRATSRQCITCRQIRKREARRIEQLARRNTEQGRTT